jgi:hypothetical protein
MLTATPLIRGFDIIAYLKPNFKIADEKKEA